MQIADVLSFFEAKQKLDKQFYLIFKSKVVFLKKKRKTVLLNDKS